MTKEEKKEYMKEYSKKYRAQNRESLRKQKKRYRDENDNKLKEESKEYYINNRERILKKVKEYGAINKKTINQYSKDWRKNNPNYTRENDLKRHFGINIEQYNEMLKNQNGVCAICGKPETATNKGKIINLAVDHCHVSGKVRGLLCGNCNKGIGHLKDNPQTLRNAAEYLESFQKEVI